MTVVLLLVKPQSAEALQADHWVRQRDLQRILRGQAGGVAEQVTGQLMGVRCG